MSTKKGPPGCLIIFFLLFGISFSVFGAIQLKNAKVSASWPTIEGEIVSSKMINVRQGGGSAYSYPKAEIIYEYTVNAEAYSSKNVYFGHEGKEKDRSHEREILLRYPSGKQVMVHYNPENPDIAVLEPGTSSGSYTLLISGIVCIAMALLAPVIMRLAGQF